MAELWVEIPTDDFMRKFVHAHNLSEAEIKKLPHKNFSALCRMYTQSDAEPHPKKSNQAFPSKDTRNSVPYKGAPNVGAAAASSHNIPNVVIALPQTVTATSVRQTRSATRAKLAALSSLSGTPVMPKGPPDQPKSGGASKKPKTNTRKRAAAKAAKAVENTIYSTTVRTRLHLEISHLTIRRLKLSTAQSTSVLGERSSTRLLRTISWSVESLEFPTVSCTTRLQDSPIL